MFVVCRKYLVYRIAKVEEERKAKEEVNNLHKRRLGRDWREKLDVNVGSNDAACSATQYE